jgi:hypothetical protein
MNRALKEEKRMKQLIRLAAVLCICASAAHAAAPLNDNFANAIALTGLNTFVRGTNTTATREVGEPNHAGNPASKSLWWKWTAPSNQTVFLDTLNSSFPTVLAVYTGTNVGGLTLIANNPDGADLVNRLSFVAAAGTTYRIAVDGAGGASGTIFLNLRSPPPVNDRFDQPTVISGTDMTLAGSNEGAMLEPGEPAHTAAVDFPPRSSIWWRWTAPFDGTVTVDTRGSAFDTFVAIYTGTVVSALTQIRSNDDEDYPAILTSKTNFSCASGVEYSIAVGGFGYQSTGSVMLHFTAVATPPSNNDFANRAWIVGTSSTVFGRTDGATREPGEPPHWTTAAGHTVWWSWLAPFNGTVVISGSSDQDPILAVYTGSTLTDLHLIDAAAVDAGVPTAEVKFTAVTNTEYQIAMDRIEGAGDVIVGVELLPTPPNDYFTNALWIVGTNATAFGTTLGGTLEPGEPRLAFDEDNSVWWNWTAPGNFTAMIECRHLDDSGSPKLGIYIGDSVSSLSNVVLAIDQNAGTRTQFIARQGTTYRILVGDYQFSAGAFRLELTSIPAPVNDFFADRVRITGISNTVTGSNLGATLEPGEPRNSGIAGAAGVRTVWWTWRSPTNAVMALDSIGSTIPTLMAVYTGADLAGLALEAANFGEHGLSFQARAGIEYQIAIDGVNSEIDSAGSLTWHLYPKPPEPPHISFKSNWPGFRSGMAMDVQVVGNLAFVAIGAGGLLILDVTDPRNPLRVGSFDTPGEARSLMVDDGFAYVADGDEGLLILDVHNPAVPSFVGQYNTLTNVNRIVVRGGLAFVADGSFGLKLFDLTDAARPQPLGGLPGQAVGLAVEGDYAYVGEGTNGLNVVNISASLNPISIARIPLPYAGDVAADRGYAYVCARTPLEGGDHHFITLSVFSVLVPSAPLWVTNTILASYGPTDSPGRVTIAGDRAYATAVHRTFDGSVPSTVMAELNVQDPGGLRLIRSLRLTTRDPQGFAIAGSHIFLAAGLEGLEILDLNATLLAPSRFETASKPFNVVVQGNYAWVASGRRGLQIIDISNPQSPFLVGGALEDAFTVAAIGAYGIVGMGDASLSTAQLAALDVGDPRSPSYQGGATAGAILGFAVTTNRAYALSTLHDFCFCPPESLFLEASGEQLLVFDLSNRGNPTLLRSELPEEDGTTFGRSMAIAGRYGFLSRDYPVWYSGPKVPQLTILDLEGSGMRIEQPIQVLGGALATSGEFLVVGGPEGVEFMHITSPTNPVPLATLTNAVSDLVMTQQRLVTVEAYRGVEIFDLADTVHPTPIASYRATGFEKIALAGNYALIAGGDQGLTILDLGPDFATSPAVNFPPAPQRALPGNNARFDVGAIGTVPIMYQWVHMGPNGTNIMLGQTNFVLRLPNVQPADAGLYYCLLNNSVGSTSTVPARLELDFPPSVSWLQPQDHQTFLSPAAVTLEVQASDIEPTGAVARVEFYAGAELLATLTTPPYHWTTNGLPAGTYSFTARATDNEGASTLSAPISISVLTNRVFQLTQTNYVVNESNRSLTVTVRRNESASPAQLGFQTLNNTAYAVDAAGNGQYFPVVTNLMFAAGEATKQINIPIVDDRVYRGDTMFLVQLFNPSINWNLAYPTNALVNILDDDDPATASSFTDLKEPDPLPGGGASFQVTLFPPTAKWRFAWEVPWRNSGSVATNLPAGSYPFELLPLAGYARAPGGTVHLDAGAHKSIGYVYNPQPETNQLGSLSIQLLPPTLAAAGQGGWRIQTSSNSGYNLSGGGVSGLLPGHQVVEFAPADGYRTPEPQELLVLGGQSTNYFIQYERTSGFLANGPLPLPGFSTNAHESYSAGAPYAFCGQIRTELGYGSGFVVKPRTVLTAAHTVFDAVALSAVTNVWWFFQKDRGAYDPPAQRPRGWYMLGGYAASRTNDIQVLHLNPLESSRTSQDRDVAALFFLNSEYPEGAGRGGVGGFLTSDTNVQWLTRPSFKKLIGYPVEGVPEEFRGVLHESRDFFDALHHETNQVYSTTRIVSFGGNSGGPLCVQSFDSSGRQFYIPAGVYLGGSGETVVRAIDLDVVNLINAAEYSATAGTNNTGGGPIIVIPDIRSSEDAAILDIIMADSPALRRGGGWKISATNYSGNLYLTNYTNFSSASATLYSVRTTLTVDMADVPCFVSPTNRTIYLNPGQDFRLELAYEPLPGPALRFDPSNGLSLWAPSGQVWRIETTTNMLGRPAWTTLMLHTSNGHTNWIEATAPLRQGSRFYRAMVPCF